MNPRWRIAVALVFLLSGGCQPTVQEQISSFNSGVAGYQGLVTPFAIPYRLRFEASPEIRQSMKWAMDLGEGETRTGFADFTVSISAIGEQRLFEYKFFRMGENGESWHSEGLPLIQLRALSSPVGPIENVDVSSPYLLQRGVKSTDEVSEKFEAAAQTFKVNFQALPEQPVSLGDETYAKDFGIELARVTLQLPNKPDVRKRLQESITVNTYSGKIVGQTYVGSAHCLVERFDGLVEVSASPGKLAVSVRGHRLIDSKVGITRRQAFAVEISAMPTDSVEQLRRSGFMSLETK